MTALLKQPLCECCYKAKPSRNRLLGSGQTKSVFLSLCPTCFGLEDKEIWIKLTKGLIDRILTEQEEEEHGNPDIH